VKLWLLILVFPFLAVLPVYPQEIVTAERYMELVSEQYGSIRDFEARILIRSGNTDMAGNLSHRSPSLLRIDFTRPAGQVILFNGEQLTVYLPDVRSVLTQVITSGRRSQSGGQGLVLLRRNYVPSFVTSPTPVPLEGSPGERVVRIRLTRRNMSEGFREIILSVNSETRLIRRMEGTTNAGGLVRFDFLDVKTNQGIPELRFQYDPPPNVNYFPNFMFRDSE